MKLSDKLELVKVRKGEPFCDLIESFDSEDKDGNPTVSTRKRHFGTVNQALCSIIDGNYELDGDLEVEIRANIKLMNDAKLDIKKHFRCEVRVSK